jgi:hypothetical protein
MVSGFRRHFPARNVIGLLLATCGLVFSATIARAEHLLVSPSQEAVCLLYYKLASATPPFDDMANESRNVQNKDEFHRPAALAEELSSLHALYASLSEVTSVQVNIQMSLGAYDAELGEFTLSGFGADEFVPFYCFGNRQVHLRLDNSPYAQSWSMNAQQAERVVARNQGSRDVSAVSTIDLVGAEKSLPGDPMVIVGKVREVRVMGLFTHAPLGKYQVPDK